MIVELRGCADGRLLADGAVMGQAVIVGASSVGEAPVIGETFVANARSRQLTYRTESRRPHARGWLVTLARVD